ncbi:HPP family protein [Roseomonas frigidaquae]|uniref:HPP family protein n=1 Tax=Falsiroseomonas frigidaquae TaxID=487318 RepID=A0ABX1ETA7_9PROT|nr:HPP family protein [Falsiroseomonas frigidaquae]
MRLFVPMLAGGSLRDRIFGCVGASLGIAVTALFCGYLVTWDRDLPLIVAPIGASAVLLFAVPASPLAQPWPIFGGNVISSIIGVAVAHVIPDQAFAASVAVGSAIVAMSLLRCLHPPGGAAALTAVIGGPKILALGYEFALFPIAINSAVLLGMGWLFHRFSGHSYPHRTATAALPMPVPNRRPAFHPDAIDKALADVGETFDITREDLNLLLQRAEFHEQRRTKNGLALPPLLAHAVDLPGGPPDEAVRDEGRRG